MLDLIYTTDFSLDIQGKREQYINRLENTILKYNNSLLLGITEVNDTIYNNCIELLTMLNPDSPLLRNDKKVKIIKKIDSEAIEYISSYLGNKEEFPKLYCYLNPQGFNVSLTYEYGELVSAKTYGRSIPNIDVLNIMKLLLTDRNDNIADLSHLEVDGVIVLSPDSLHIAEDVCDVKDCYQGVFSVLSYISSHEEDFLSSSENYEDIVTFVATDIRQMYGIPFENIENKLQFLESLSFETPKFIDIERTNHLSIDLENLLYMAENVELEFPYISDGIRLFVLDDLVILFKIGMWKIRSFEGVVDEVEWVDMKCKKLPIVKFSEPIRVSDGVTISEIMLNNVNLLLILNVELGNIIHFAYFGDMGILPMTENEDIILN